MLVSFINNDILGLSNDTTVAAKLLTHPNELIRDQVSRLLNIIATDCIGREYLLSNHCRLVTDMMHAFKLETQDTTLRQNILGTLQKLSLRFSDLIVGARHNLP